jgi:mannose-6-phosphate isomerase
MKIYPLKFSPILQHRIWGGNKLSTVLGKPADDGTGESWELSAVNGNVSVVDGGEYDGRPLSELLDEFAPQILGEKVSMRFGKEFPLLFKFIDAREDLSIQVHPNDELAQIRHNSMGKTEMWYVMQADPGARLIVGFKHKSSAEEYIKHLEDGSLLAILDEVPVSAGDVFYLEAGTIHAIGAGILLAEIQQTSDVTYRVYDWDRKDADGNGRELHVDLALDAMNYNLVDAKAEYSKNQNQINRVVDSPYFTTSVLPLDGSVDLEKSGDSFHVYMVVDGGMTITCDAGAFKFKKGSTILVPAALRRYTLAGRASVLEVFIS